MSTSDKRETGRARMGSPLDSRGERPIAVDLFSGLGGWAEGLAATGWHVIRFDIEDMCKLLGEPYPEHSSLVLQDCLTLHGAQFANVGLIVSSSPCQEFSYRAMPWKRAKALPPPYRGMEMFHAQFRIQREASEAAGRHIPMVCENVRGAQPWVGRARANFGSYYLWGDVPALMPQTASRGQSDGVKIPGRTMCHPAGSANPEAVKGRTGKLHWQDDGQKVPGFRFDGSGRSFQTAAVEGVKMGTGGWFNDGDNPNRSALMSSKSHARKAASAKIAKIPLTLSTWIGRCWLPEREAA